MRWLCVGFTFAPFNLAILHLFVRSHMDGAFQAFELAAQRMPREPYHRLGDKQQQRRRTLLQVCLASLLLALFGCVRACVRVYLGWHCVCLGFGLSCLDLVLRLGCLWFVMVVMLPLQWIVRITPLWFVGRSAYHLGGPGHHLDST